MNKFGVIIGNIRNPIVFAWGFFLFLNFGCIVYGHSQKVIEKSWDTSVFDKLEIVSDEVFKIKIETKPTSVIKLTTKIEGENFENVTLEASEKVKTLTLKPTYSPYFEAKNNKLAAHKLISIEMTLTLPESMEVFINATIASLEMHGKILNLDVNLRDGHCVLYNFIGNASLNTKQGDITVFAKENVSGIASSKNGMVLNQLLNEGLYLLKAQSVNGNISLLKTPK
ncbi:MAG: hypothetical protein R2781_11755 [Flavobacteriaceae bacterium]